MRTLLIDNYDSYTYNLYHLLAQVYGRTPVVVRNDDSGWDRIVLDDFDAAVISPGPGHPASCRDFGHSRAVLRRQQLPVLGVCLGHQGIGLVAGARVVRAPRPRHGHLARVAHTGDGVFAGIPQRFTAVRYHSLCVAPPLPAELEAVAWAEDGVIMGLRHRGLPRWGVQFHPESICTEYGARLVANFRELALRSANSAVRRSVVPPSTAAPGFTQPTTSAVPAAPTALPTPTAVPTPPAVPTPTAVPTHTALATYTAHIDAAVDAEAAFITLYGASTRAFWLDSALVEQGRSRFSFLGSADGPDGEVLTFRVGDESVTVAPSGSVPYAEKGTIFDALRNRLGRPVVGAEDLPFDLTGGYVGYFGYEMKVECGAAKAHRADTPDAVWLRADRLIAVDHLERRTYVVAVVSPEAAESALSWIELTAATLRGLPESGPEGTGPLATEDPEDPEDPEDLDISRWLVRSRERYLDDIAECRHQLRAGESYEICLTDKLRLPAPQDDLAYYLRLRRLNPAPYSALLLLGELTVFSSSPERFLRIDTNRTVESKPIKGTAGRSADPHLDEQLRRSLQHDDKARAENLMIVDLLRNDLGRVSEIGSVTVPTFLVTESYATVHQLVSTIRATLRRNVTALDCVRACFPGGSMTGAPKLRTMEIIDSLENEARGVYSGTLGYFGFTGTADLNIVIRTAVRWRDELTIGAGGAIVLDSVPLAEYEEMSLKTQALLRAVPVPAHGAALGRGHRGGQGQRLSRQG